MPKLDGFGVVERIRAHEASCGLRPTPIVAYTADVNFREEELRALGMQGLLVKPADLKALREILQRVLGESKLDQLGDGNGAAPGRSARGEQAGVLWGSKVGLENKRKTLKRRDTWDYCSGT